MPKFSFRSSLSVVGRNQSRGRKVFVAGTFVLVAGVSVSVLAVLTGSWDRLKSTAQGVQVRRIANTYGSMMVTAVVPAPIKNVLRRGVPRRTNPPTVARPGAPASADDFMSPAQFLADSEVAVTSRTPDPLGKLSR